MSLTKVSFSMITGAPINVLDVGATGNGSTNDTAAIQAAFDSIASTGGALYFPKGTYLVPNGINFRQSAAESNNTYYIYGDGAKESIIITENANISLDLGGRNRVCLYNFGIRDSGTTAKVAIARYRDTTIGSDGGGSYHTYENLYIEGMFSFGAIYSIGSEVNNHYNIQINQNGNGPCYFTTYTNYLGLTAAGTITGGSNTVNNFYGGYLIGAPSTTGGALYVATGITDNLNFYGTYFVGYAGGYVVKLGFGNADSMQGTKIFNGCRFEGTGVGFNCTGAQVEGLTVISSTFGQTNQDIYFNNTPSGGGLENACIQDNIHYAYGMTIPVITRSVISVIDTFTYYANAITVSTLISSSQITSSNLILGGSCTVFSSIISNLDVQNNIYKTIYGPNSKTSGGNSQGSVVVNNPFGTAPISPSDGTIVTAGASNWDPTSTGATTDYPVFYDGSNWRAMIPVFSTPASATATGVKGTLAVDASYLYVCTAVNTWKRILLTW